MGQQATLKLPPFIVTPAWWVLWLGWCRTFTITGRVICPETGFPVPGAEVRAFDVDFFWWWLSSSQVGPTVDHGCERTLHYQVHMVLWLVAMVVVAVTSLES